MVATRGDIVHYVLGTQSPLDPRDIRPTEWEDIIQGLIGKLQLNYLRNFVPISKVHNEHGVFSGTRCETVIKPKVIAKDLPNLKPNAVFLECCTLLHRPLTTDAWPLEETQGKESGIGQIYAQMPATYLLLGRSGKFHLLTVVWKYTQEWGSLPGTKPVSEKYEGVRLDMGPVANLADLIALYPKCPVGLATVRSLFAAMQRTRMDLDGQFRHVQEGEFTLRETLVRLGEKNL